MVFYGHDVLDKEYDMEKIFQHFEGEMKITTADEVYNLESCCLHTKAGIYYGTSMNGADVKIPAADVISIEGSA